MQDRRFVHFFLTPDSYSRITWIYVFIIDPHNPSYIDSYMHARGVAIFYNKMLNSRLYNAIF